MKTHNLMPSLAETRKRIEEYAREMGLDFFDTIFQVVNYEEINEIASYGGFPNRYPHWRFGMEYDQMRKQRSYGLATIYEMVINTDPSYAYLLDCNSAAQQKMVMAHVFGHVDFFKNNHSFDHTNRKMMDEMANHATKIRKYADRHGMDKVENFMDLCLSLEHLIDPDKRYMPDKREQKDDDDIEIRSVPMLNVEREYMSQYINPQEYIKAQIEKAEAKRKGQKKNPPGPQKDILEFLIKHAPLSSWQRSTLDMIREESYYYSPQRQTKILNEGWACFCHSKIMTTRAMDPSELIDYAECHAGVTSMGSGRLNPYALGLALLKDIEERWNKGIYGKEYDECENLEKKRLWDTRENKGLEKLFQVRKIHNDITFIDEFLTREFVEQQMLWTYSRHEHEKGAIWTIDSKQFEDIKEKLLFQLTNFGLPSIYLTEANYKNRGELLLHHRWEGITLDIGYATRTLKNIEKIWGRPVNIEACTSDEKWHIIRCESGNLSHKDMEDKELSWQY